MISTVGVVVPVANEQDHLPACLDALTIARRQAVVHRPGVRVRILVVLDGCTDRSASIVASYGDIESLVVTKGRVGAVRAAGVRYLLTTSGRLPASTWLANTDGDSAVPADWLTAMIAAAEAGAHVVLGTVLPGPGLGAVASRAWYAQHRLHENHDHVHGANFGIRADTYARLGGWPDLDSKEDVALAEAAAADPSVRVLRTASLPVITSTRLVARAPKGFSSYLRGLDSLAVSGVAGAAAVGVEPDGLRTHQS